MRTLLLLFVTIPLMLGLLPLGLALAFLSGLPGLIGWAMASAAFMAFTLQGLAAAHVLTRGWPQRRRITRRCPTS